MELQSRVGVAFEEATETWRSATVDMRCIAEALSEARNCSASKRTDLEVHSSSIAPPN